MNACGQVREPVSEYLKEEFAKAIGTMKHVSAASKTDAAETG